jgi:hypothetical protein
MSPISSLELFSGDGDLAYDEVVLKATCALSLIPLAFRTMPEIPPAPRKDRSHWTMKKFSSHEELRTFGIKEWQKQSGATRRQAAWELVYDYWVGTKKMHPDELRLQRTVTSVQHPRG